MFAQNLATITKLATDAATSLSNLSTAGSTACDCGDAQCGAAASPFRFLIGHSQPQRSAVEPTREPEPKPEPEPEVAPAGLGNIVDSEVLVHICSFLAPKDLGRLACAARCFSTKVEWSGSSSPEMRSVIEESVRRWAMASMQTGEQEQAEEMNSWLRRKQILVLKQSSADELVVVARPESD
eukprot:COSAG02_NODE_264_length_26618_cov_244.096459_8_plen_182_part_00